MKSVEELRYALKPKGTANVCRLAPYGMYDSDFISSCIDDIEKLHLKVMLGEPVSNLEKLAISILMDSAGIEG